MDPLSCKLSVGDLQQRLAEIVALGRQSLISHQAGEGRHVLRFRADEDTRARLQKIVAAESECCPFLDLDLRQENTDLVLTIAAPADGRPIARDLADAFARPA